LVESHTYSQEREYERQPVHELGRHASLCDNAERAAHTGHYPVRCHELVLSRVHQEQRNAPCILRAEIQRTYNIELQRPSNSEHSTEDREYC